MTNFGKIVILKDPVRLFEATSQAREMGKLDSKWIVRSTLESFFMKAIASFMVVFFEKLFRNRSMAYDGFCMITSSCNLVSDCVAPQVFPHLGSIFLALSVTVVYSKEKPFTTKNK